MCVTRSSPREGASIIFPVFENRLGPQNGQRKIGKDNGGLSGCGRCRDGRCGSGKGIYYAFPPDCNFQLTIFAVSPEIEKGERRNSNPS